MKQLLTDPNVRQLISQFDLDEPKLAKILVDKYEFIDGKIVISSAKVLNDDMSVNREADLQKLLPRLSECNLIFRKL
jgi:hypothetical protein